MPITLDTTIGGASANSYVDLPAADAYHDARLNTDSWTGATADNKTRALLMATERLQSENWLGNRVTTTQRLAWPRWGAAKRDSVGLGYGLGGYYTGFGYAYGEPYLTTEIPQPVKDAQCELALSFLEGVSDAGVESLQSFTADGVTMKFDSSSPSNGLPARVVQLLSGLTVGDLLVRG